MERKTIIMLDLIRAMNVLSFSLLLGILLSKIGVGRYIVFLTVLCCCTILAYITKNAFTKKYGVIRNDILENMGFIILAISVNILLVSYYILVKEYVFIFLLLAFFICHSYVSNKDKEGKKVLKWRIQNV